jgi:penicillin amidase
MSRSSRSTLAIALAVVAVAGGAYLATRSAASGSAGDATDLKIAGLKQTVDVYRDAKGTPHIFAKNEDDLFLAYGYVVAEDRLFQIDYNRRTAAGRVAEIRGPELIASDKYFRTLGLKKLAEDVIAKSDAETLRALEQFSKGINAYIDSHRNNLPVEFKELGYAPGPWTPVDTMLSWYDFGHALDVRRWEGEITNGELLARLGKDAEQLLPMSDTSATIVQRGEMTAFARTDQTARVDPPAGLITDDALIGEQ